MAIIAITITASSEQYVDGIPRYVTIQTSIPSSVFYTTDGSVPTINSDIYPGGQLILPTNIGAFILKLFATNGTDSSPIIDQYYGPNNNGIRKLFAKVLNVEDTTNSKYFSFPYSDRGPISPADYDGVGLEMMHNPDNVGIFDGYDGQGNVANLLDKNVSEYGIKYSTTNNLGETGPGIGNLPAQVTLQEKPPAPNYSETTQRSFDPKARVIYQDATKQQADPDLALINRPHFSLEPLETTRDGAFCGSTEPLPITGSFIRASYNPNDSSVTFYYFDSQSLRWIISKQPYTMQTSREKEMSNMVTDTRTPGSRYVYKWVPFNRRVLT